MVRTGALLVSVTAPDDGVAVVIIVKTGAFPVSEIEPAVGASTV